VGFELPQNGGSVSMKKPNYPYDDYWHEAPSLIVTIYPFEPFEVVLWPGTRTVRHRPA